MEKITVRVTDEQAEEIDRRADADDVSKSEAVRDLLRRGTEYDSIREERDRLQRQYRQLVDQREEHTELVEYVERERDLQQRREERRTAPLWRRAKWYVLGAPGDTAAD
jgi:Arc/MetJ-type ribon-helix-helix transcriptional regulator